MSIETSIIMGKRATVYKSKHAIIIVTVHMHTVHCTLQVCTLYLCGIGIENVLI